MSHNLLAVREMVEVARRAKTPLQVSHLIFVGRRSWDTVNEVLADIERARNDGVDVAFDTFPYTGGNTTIRVLFPAWSQNGLVALLNSAEGWARLRERFRPMNSVHSRRAQLLWAVKPSWRISRESSSAKSPSALKLDPARPT